MQRSYGPDVWLSLRMAVALVLVALIYFAGMALFLGVAVSAALDGAWLAAVGCDLCVECLV